MKSLEIAILGAPVDALDPALEFSGPDGAGFEPFDEFRVTIGEGEDAGVLMASGGEIDPGFAAPGADDEAGVFDAALVFVDERDGLDGGGRSDLAEAMPARPIVRFWDVVHETAQGHAADAADPAFIADGGTVGGAFVDAGLLIVGKEDAAFDVGGGRVGEGVAGDPGAGAGIQALTATVSGRLVRGELVIEIVNVKSPGQGQLPVISETLYLCRLGFGATEGWKEHSGENGDDGDDDEQFNQGEGRVSCQGCENGVFGLGWEGNSVGGVRVER